MTDTHRRRIRPLLFFALLVASASCSDSTGTGSFPCNGTVTASASAGRTPTFTWSPACLVSAIQVQDNGSDMWFVSTPGAGIRSGTKYGSTPSGAIVGQAPLGLVTGTTYDLILYAGDATGLVSVIATKQFTP